MTTAQARHMTQRLAELYRQAVEEFGKIPYASMTPEQYADSRRLPDLDAVMMPARWLVDGAKLEEYGLTTLPDGRQRIHFVLSNPEEDEEEEG